MKRALATTVAALLCACGGSQLSASEARNAMSSAQQAQIGTPSAGNALTASAALTAYQTAPYASDTINLAAAVNGGVVWTLGVVKAVVETFPPTSCAGDTCTWGPGSGAQEVNDWQLNVTKKADRDYTWTLQGKSKVDPSAPWITFVSGEAFTTDVKNVGHGTLLVDMESAKGLAHLTTDPVQSGTIHVTYDNTSGRNVTAQFLATDDASDPGTKVNAAYAYAASAAGGDLQVSTRNLTTQATFQLHSRWTDVGAGRGDAQFAQSGNAIARSQCWDGAATLFDWSYQGTELNGAPFNLDGTDRGVETSCVFPAAVLPTLAVP